MNNLEDQLRDALRRQDPSPDFAERVVRRAGPAPAPFRAAAPQRTRKFAWLAAAAVAAGLLIAVPIEYRRQQAERASQQAVEALQIVADELNSAQAELLTER